MRYNNHEKLMQARKELNQQTQELLEYYENEDLLDNDKVRKMEEGMRASLRTIEASTTPKNLEIMKEGIMLGYLYTIINNETDANKIIAMVQKIINNKRDSRSPLQPDI